MSNGLSKNNDLAVSDIVGLPAVSLYACFFLSGVAGLIYEVLWAKYLALYMGSTGLAQIIVLATFMGGMALGSQILGRMADRVRSPLKFYVILEFGIGLYAILFDQFFGIGRILFISMVRVTGLSTGGLFMAKAVACVLSILLPTFLMGGTLPSLGRFMIRSMNRVGPRIARLYFLNSLGAVFGCLLAGFYLIRALGLQFSMITGGAINILVGLVALIVLSRQGQGMTEQATSEPPEPAAASVRMPTWIFVVVLTAVSLSGAVSMMYEVAWIRLLTLVLGSSTYSFSLMLATFILGLSIGGFLLSLRKKTTGYTVIFGICEVAVGAAVLLSLPFYIRLPYWFNQVASSLSREAATFGLYQWCKLMLCAGVMFIPTILQGITLPAATKVLMRDMRAVGKRVGYIYAINTLGTLIGATFAGFGGLPWLGIKGTLELAVILNGLLGLAVLITETNRAVRKKALVVACFVLLGVWTWYAFSMGPWDKQVLTSGVYRTRERIGSFDEMIEVVNQRKTVFYRDGVDATIAVQDIEEPAPARLLVINGKVDASTQKDLPTQKMLAHLPLLLHKNPEKVLIVGVGSGATIGSAIAYDIEKLDVVELSRDVIEASRLFETINGRYWEDERVDVYWEDAKTFLQVTDDSYDVIISEPTNPWIAGIAGVFSQEYFEQCRQHLTEDGFFLQWIQAYELEDATFFMMQETFSRVFPYYTLWNPTYSDTILIGSIKPYRPDFVQMRARIQAPAVQQDLNIMGVSRLMPILMLQMTDRASQYSHVDWLGAVHSDFFPILEYVAPRGFFVGSSANAAKWMDERSYAPANADLWIHQYLAQYKPDSTDFSESYDFARNYPGLFDMLAFSVVSKWIEQDAQNPDAMLRYVSGLSAYVRRNAEVVVPMDNANPNLAIIAGKVHCRILFEDYLATRNFLTSPGCDEALNAVWELQKAFPDVMDPDIYYWCGVLQYDKGFYKEAVANLMSAAQLYGNQSEKQHIEASELLCRCLLKLGDVNQAISAYQHLLMPYENEFKVKILQSFILAELARQQS